MTLHFYIWYFCQHNCANTHFSSYSSSNSSSFLLLPPTSLLLPTTFCSGRLSVDTTTLWHIKVRLKVLLQRIIYGLYQPNPTQLSIPSHKILFIAFQLSNADFNFQSNPNLLTYKDNDFAWHQEWHIRHEFTLGRCLGKGSFGQVAEATMRGFNGGRI